VLASRLLCVGALSLAASLAVGAGRASAAEIDWRSELPCDRRARVAQEVERLVGRPLEEVDSADFTVTVRRNAGGLVELQIETTPRNAALDPALRTLTGATCEELIDAAALAMAMTVSGYQAQQESPRERTEDSAASEARDAPAPPAPPAPAREPITVSLGGGLALDVGAFPDAGIGAQVALSLRHRWLTLSPLGVFFPRSTADAPNGAGAEFRSTAGGLLACVGPSSRWVVLGACAGYEAGKLRGRGTGLRQPRAGSSLWSAVRGELQVHFLLLARARLTASAGITVPTARGEFEIEGGLVHRPSVVTGRFGLGIEVSL
jgi:hypothetical protein